MHTELLYKYLSGACSETEIKKVEDWLKESSKHRDELREVKKIMEVSPGKAIQVDADKAWEAFRKNHLEETPGHKKENPAQSFDIARSLKNRRVKRSGIKTFAYTAAAAAVLLITFFLYQSNSPLIDTPNPELLSQEITTQRGQRTMVRLSDGTRVHLNAESKLSVPQNYMEDNRTVQLDGEAFFEVASNKEKPFIVQTGRSVTRVLGTKFNVTAYPEAEQVQVVVAEGKVALGSEDGFQTPEVQLTKNQRGVINREGEINASIVPDVQMYLDWSRGMLTFQDAKLDDVEKRLERWYAIDVIFGEDISTENRRLTGSFKDVSMTGVFNSIALSLDLNYEKEGREITFTAK